MKSEVHRGETIHVPTKPYPAALTVLAVLCYPDDSIKRRDLYEAGLSWLIRQQRQGHFQNKNRLVCSETKELLKRWQPRKTQNALKAGNRRLWYRYTAVELFLVGGIFRKKGGINSIILDAEADPDLDLDLDITDRRIRSSILEPTRPVFPVAIALHNTMQIQAEKFSHPQSLETLLYCAEQWVHGAVNQAAAYAVPACWRATIEASPALHTTDPDNFVRFLVEDDFPAR